MSLRFLARSEAQDQSAYRITFSDGKQHRVLEREEFVQVGDVQFDAGPFDTATSSTLRVACSVLTEEGEALATEEVRLPLRSDWRYSVDCAVGQLNPYRVCFGCMGFNAKPLGPSQGFASGDSLFVVWGGTSISSPVHY